MSDYKKPEWYVLFWKPEGVTDEQLAAWKTETDEVNAANALIWQATYEKYKALLALALEVYGKKSKPFLYLTKSEPSRPMHCSFSDAERRVKEARLKQAGEAKLAEEARQRTEHQAKAVAWLLGKGKKLGTDFTGENAVDVADSLAFDEEVARLKASGEMHEFEFDGPNCDGPCAGWDGTDRRCECGNRRVSWVTGYGHSFANPDVRGEAY